MRVTSIDVSEDVISQMKERHSREGALEWAVMDCTKMTFANATFDAVFDKGTLDTLLCYDNGPQMAERMSREAARLLKSGGPLFVVSYGILKTRKRFFDRAGLTITDGGPVPTPGIPTGPFIYVLRPE
jgi:RAT1-interacting protein